MECDCASSNADESKWLKTIEMGKQNFKYTSNSEAAENPPSNHPLFHQVPGLTTKFVGGVLCISCGFMAFISTSLA